MSVPFGTIAAVLIIALTLYKVAIWANNKRQKRKALAGDYGEETKWAAELVEDGDQDFALAVASLPRIELREVGIIADTKDELRRRTIERFEEATDD